MKMNNKGFSLVELIVIMSVMAILIGIGVRNFGVLDSYNSRQCKTKLVSALQNNKMDALSKSATNTESSDANSTADTYLLIEYDSGSKSIYATSVVKGVNGTKEKLTKGTKTKITFKCGATSITIPDDQTSYRIGFCRSNGAILATGGSTCSEIDVTVGYKVRQIYLETKTGKILSEGKK